jgi:RES domain
MIVFRHADPRFPFLWEGAKQPAGRWNGSSDGPVQYFADTPDGAWAEFLRHEGITKPEELANVRRAIWAVEVPDDLPLEIPQISQKSLSGGTASYRACRAEARRLRSAGARALRAPSAALVPGGARGWKVDGGLQPAAPRDGTVLVLFGMRPDLTGWVATMTGSPQSDLLSRVRSL